MTAGAVFLSYASEDAEAARRICESLRTVGIEVWLDQSELRGGDVWDQKIRRQIHDCALFIPVISANTASRQEGYFRLEWDLADQRTHMMARDRPFIVPVYLDAAPGAGTDVPESFHRVQSMRLPGGEAHPDFAARIKRLLSPEPASIAQRTPSSGSDEAPIPVSVGAPSSLRRGLPVTIAVLAVAALAYWLIYKPSGPRHEATAPLMTSATAPSAPATPAAAAFTPPPHSIAVLPFVNLSGDKEQEYFSDGLTEELLNSLAEIEELQVAARTSSFSFKEHPDIVTVAHKLNVAAVLEGSVRRSANTVRVTVQLINAATGFHLWSKTYDRDLGDVLKLQTEIATAVATALKVTLLGDISTKIELGGTHNPAAFDAYLRGSKPLYRSVGDAKGLQSAIGEFTEAIRLDPKFALAFASRSLALDRYAAEYAPNPAATREDVDKALIDARQAITLAPELAEGYRALAMFGVASQQYRQASEAYERAVALAPGNARVLPEYARFTVLMGRADAGIAVGRRAVALDPLNPNSHYRLGDALHYARRYEEAVAAYDAALALEPDNGRTLGGRGLAYYALGNFQTARASCEAKPDHWLTQWCLAVVYEKLGRHADAEAELAKLKAANGDTVAYQYATIYAQWGNRPKSLEWLDTALRVRDPGLIFLKMDPLLDALRKDPRFQEIERQLKFPS
ncbi:MAG TPA: TIR domain-containing protein [Steroidobacteraceae bacterium]|nr:TIR domain-containing protein [Steroidobacteraceae bacterium]